MRRTGIEHLSVFGLDPVAFAQLARRLDCDSISIALASGDYIPHGYPGWSLRNDSGLRADFRNALVDQGIAVSLGDGLLGWPGQTVASMLPDLDLFAELGAECANIVLIDPDLDQSASLLAAFAEAAAERGLRASVEFLPGIPLGTLDAALAMVRSIGSPALGVVLDAMHLFRSGGCVADVAALERQDIAYVQLCDVPLQSTGALSYADEARYERKVPGEGELPLLDFLRACPEDKIVSIEVPQRSLAEAGIGPEERLRPAVARTRELLALI
jgi:sugar phosphate isomerase/epimerase